MFFVTYYGLVKTCKTYIPKLDYVAHSSVQLLNYIQNEAMHNVSVHHQPPYY